MSDGYPEDNQLGPMVMTPERIAALDQLWDDDELVRAEDHQRRGLASMTGRGVEKPHG